MTVGWTWDFPLKLYLNYRQEIEELKREVAVIQADMNKIASPTEVSHYMLS
jgi:hypothetical protein